MIDPAKLDEICERIAAGESLQSICNDREMPGSSTVYRWLNENADFREKYADARARQADFYADQIVTLADTAEDHNKARLQIDARKWVAAKLLPKKYGEKVTQTVEGGDKPVQIDNVSEVEAARRVAFLLTKAAKAKD